MAKRRIQRIRSAVQIFCKKLLAMWRSETRRKVTGKILAVFCAVAVAGVTVGCCFLAVSAAVCDKMSGDILSVEELSASGEAYDCILILGCKVYENGELSHMLQDRMLTGIALYQAGVSDTLLVSGDHRTDAYNEVDAMKAFAVERGIPSERVFQDHDGYSTYDSIARLKSVYGGKRVVIVTQQYHLYRAVYLADQLGMDAVGVPADLRSYRKQWIRDIREVLARCKDVYLGVKQPAPEVTGDTVDLSGNGNTTAQSRPDSQ